MILVVAACGSSEDDASATTASRPPSPTTTAATEAPTTTTTPATTQEAPTASSPVAGTSDDPAATIEDYRTAYNAGDVDGVMALFSEESVMTGNSFFESAGLTEIRAVWVEDINGAATEDAYTISNVEVTGNTVTWDQVWIGGAGDKNCIEGQSAVIEDGKILLWTWSSRDVSCP
jgi:hypothetical protein